MIGKGSLEGGKISFRILSEEEQKKEEETQRVLQQCLDMEMYQLIIQKEQCG